jgi:hypothetical protein
MELNVLTILVINDLTCLRPDSQVGNLQSIVRKVCQFCVAGLKFDCMVAIILAIHSCINLFC